MTTPSTGPSPDAIATPVRRKTVPLRFKVFCYLAYLLLKVIQITCRHRYENVQRVRDAARGHPNGATAFAFWHENSAAGFMSQRNRKIAPMISRSPDGEIAAFIASHLGMRPVRGSTAHQGRHACAEYASLVKEGYTIALTVDGPTGPRHASKPGIVHLASQYQVPILPFNAKAKRYWTLRTWDLMKIPKPFTLIVTTWGEPIHVPRDLSAADVDRYQSMIDEALMALET